MPEGTKTVRITGITNDHTHTYNDDMSGNTSVTNEHSHPYTVSADNKVKILEAADHTHAPSAINKSGKSYVNKTVSFNVKEVKEIHDDNGEFAFFEGFASTFGNVDLDDDVILPGAFQNTINLGRQIALLWSHFSSETIGQILSLHEETKGLWVQGRINLGVQRGREALALLKAGDIHSLSIGFNFSFEDAIFEKGVMKIETLDLFEVSLVAIPANPQAKIDMSSIKAVVPFKDLPLADRDVAWDSTAAIRRVRVRTDSEESASKTYRNAFFWYDAEKPENFGSYKLPFVDVIDNRLMAIPRGIFAVAAVLQGARGGVDLPQSDQDKIKINVSKYYKKMDLIAPWDRDNGKALILENINLAEKFKDLEKILKDQGFNNIESKAFIAILKKLSNHSNVEKTEREASTERLQKLISVTQDTINFLKNGE